mmetsp:Transcript_26061/g.75278  ORF Transcript_26061/g.75278 Transcript_26061/m.75278 type:complete len:237 (-) Transcript_26061:189-899(-)
MTYGLNLILDELHQDFQILRTTHRSRRHPMDSGITLVVEVIPIQPGGVVVLRSPRLFGVVQDHPAALGHEHIRKGPTSAGANHHGRFRDNLDLLLDAKFAKIDGLDNDLLLVVECFSKGVDLRYEGEPPVGILARGGGYGNDERRFLSDGLHRVHSNVSHHKVAKAGQHRTPPGVVTQIVIGLLPTVRLLQSMIGVHAQTRGSSVRADVARLRLRTIGDVQHRILRRSHGLGLHAH